jgi:hypothetical protein
MTPVSSNERPLPAVPSVEAKPPALVRALKLLLAAGHRALTSNAWSVRHERGAFGFEERAQPNFCR